MPYDGRSPILVAETEQRVLIELQRPALGELKDARALGAAKQLLEIKSLKREQIALRGGLEARGVVFRDVVSYYRVWNGFAATVKTSDIPRLSLSGLAGADGPPRLSGLERAGPGARQDRALDKAGLNGTPPIAVLDTGIDSKRAGGVRGPRLRRRRPRPRPQARAA